MAFASNEGAKVSVGGFDFDKAHQAAKRRMNTNKELIGAASASSGGQGSAPSVVPSGTTRGGSVPATGNQLMNWLKQAGFKGEELRKAWAVAMRESGGRPGAYNGNTNTGDRSYGLFQINMLGSLGPARMKQFGLKSERDLLDPLTNARAAYQMSRGGWSAWDIDETGYNYRNNRASWQKHYNAYMKYYNMFPTAYTNATRQSAAALKVK